MQLDRAICIIEILKKKIKRYLFAYRIIIYLKNSKEWTEKLLQITGKFSKVTGYEFNLQKLIAYICRPKKKVKDVMERSHWG